jgi:putative lipoic acid-binding regulatory protein
MYNLKKNQEGKIEILNDRKDKAVLEYPCTWSYKLISLDKKLIQEAIREIIIGKEHTLKKSNKSKTGKYISMNLDLFVQNEDERNFIYESFKKHKHIKMVL